MYQQEFFHGGKGAHALNAWVRWPPFSQAQLRERELVAVEREAHLFKSQREGGVYSLGHELVREECAHLLEKGEREREPCDALLEGPLGLTISLLSLGTKPQCTWAQPLWLPFTLCTHACFLSWFLPLARDATYACPHTSSCVHALRAWFHAFQRLSPKTFNFPSKPNPFGKGYYLDDLGYY